jgi:hypothetical protein
MKISLKIFILLFPLFTLCQTLDDQVEYIFNFDGTFEYYKKQYSKLSKQAKDKNEKILLENIEKKLTDEDIKKRLIKSYLIIFSEEEINTVYTFLNTSASKKMLDSKNVLRKEIDKNFQDIQNEIEAVKEKYVYANRENGFYETLNYKKYDDNTKLILAEKPILTKEDISEVITGFNDMGFCVLNITLTPKGALILKNVSSKNIDKPLAIVVNKKIISAPIITSEIAGGKLEISGQFSLDEANKIAEPLKK